jgi:hypothetical protein
MPEIQRNRDQVVDLGYGRDEWIDDAGTAPDAPKARGYHGGLFADLGGDGQPQRSAYRSSCPRANVKRPAVGFRD